ncbi:MAG: DUF6268 family outer membrane beta-barrel protein [Opitutaceae bacterium]
MRPPRSTLPSLAAALLAALPAFAQPITGNSRGGSGPGGRPAAARIGLTVDAAFTGRVDFSAAGLPAGDMAVKQTGAKLSVPLPPLGGGWFPLLSLRYRHHDLDTAAGTPLPQHFQGLSAGLGLFGNLSPDWSLFASVSPGVANAGSGFTSKGMSVGVIAVASRKFGNDFSAGAGFVFDSLARGSGRLMPVATFDWSPGPGWKAWVGYPRTGVSWEAGPSLKAEFVAEADFGSFYVTEDPRTPRPGQVRLDRTRLEYRAVRVGPAVTWKPEPLVSLRLGAGVVPMVRADYEARNYELRSEKAAGFASFELDWRF